MEDNEGLIKLEGLETYVRQLSKSGLGYTIMEQRIDYTFVAVLSLKASTAMSLLFPILATALRPDEEDGSS